MLAVYGDQSVVLVRESTKIYREILTRRSNDIYELVAFLKKILLKGVPLDRRRSQEEELDLEGSTWSRDHDTLVQEGMKKKIKQR